jgi:hypothetical protein
MANPESDEMANPESDEMANPESDEMANPESDETVANPESDEMANPESDETVANPESDETVANPESDPKEKDFNWVEGPEGHFRKPTHLPKWWQSWIETKRRDAEDLVGETVRFSEKRTEQLNTEVLELQTEVLELQTEVQKLQDIIENRSLTESLTEKSSPRVKKNVSEQNFFPELVMTATAAIATIVIISLIFCFVICCMQKKICCFSSLELAPAVTAAPAPTASAAPASVQATTAAPASMPAATAAPASMPAATAAPASMPAATAAPAPAAPTAPAAAALALTPAAATVPALATTPNWDPKFFLEAGIELESLRREKIPAAPQPNPFGHFQSAMPFNPFFPVHPSFYHEQRRHRRNQHSSEDEDALELEHKPRSTRKKS